MRTVAAVALWVFGDDIAQLFSADNANSSFVIPAGFKVVEVEQEILDGSNPVYGNGDIIDIVWDSAAADRPRETLVVDAMVFCNLDHKWVAAGHRGPVLVGVLLADADAKSVAAKQKNGDVFVIGTVRTVKNWQNSN